MTDFNLNMHTARLLMQEPFFASLSRRIDKTPTTSIPTAGVCINPERQQFEMLYNPEFFAQLSDEQKLGCQNILCAITLGFGVVCGPILESEEEGLYKGSPLASSSRRLLWF